MARFLEFFGHQIDASFPATLADQVHDVLCEEIHNERWAVGERLPSLSTLVRMTGLSRNSILRAMDRLEEEGYIRQEERKGAFLAAVLPNGRSSLGVIGIVSRVHTEATSPMSAAWDNRRAQRINQAATERGYSTEIYHMSEGEDYRLIDSVEGPFGRRVKGIVSLYAFPRVHPREIPSDRHPIVFYGVENEDCSPCVLGDDRDAIRELTRHVIRAGHRAIIYCDSGQLLPRHSNLGFRGHQQAMQEAGLADDDEARRQSLAIGQGNLPALRDYLETFSEATAIVCATGEVAQDVITVTDMTGVRVPEDLSVVSHSSQSMRRNSPAPCFTSLDFNGEFHISICFKLLFDQIKTRQCPVTRILIKPFVLEGDSLAPPCRSRSQRRGARGRLVAAGTLR